VALIPTHYVDTQYPSPVGSQKEWCEQRGNMVVQRGYYQDPTGDNEILIESRKSVQNFFGTEIQRTEDAWQYERLKSPPLMHTREIKSNVWLPRLGGRQLRTVQLEETQYHTFTPLAGGNVENLAKTRRVSAYVVYDTPLDETKPTDADTSSALAAADVTPGPTRDRYFHTGRLWSEATEKGTIVPEEGHNQITKWVPDVITETDLVDEEWDRWIIVTVTKNSLRPGDVQVSEPREIKKPNIRYSLPVPLDPPKLDALPGSNGVRIQVTEGGCYLPGGWLNDAIRILPETYKVYRAVISEPDRTSDTNWNSWWNDGDEPADKNRAVIENTAVTELDTGTPTSAIPAASGHTEPHDPEPPEPDRETVFELIATLDNEHETVAAGRGFAEFTDPDVVNGGEYEYFATCAYGEDESSDSNHETVTYNGSEGRSYRIGLRKNVPEDEANGVRADHVDITPPNEPSLASDDYGSVLEFEVPTSDDPVEVATEVGDRQYSLRISPDVISFDLLTPVPHLEFAMPLSLPEITWNAYGNGLKLESRTIPRELVLVGFVREINRQPDGRWGSPATTVRAQEFPR